MKAAFLFPGQGAQRVGMGADLARDFPAAHAVYEEADGALGFALSRLCFEGPEAELILTSNTQPATLATSIAAMRAFQAEAGAGVEPVVAAGHSVGEYTALVAAGAINFADAIRAVRERGKLMEVACPPGMGTMAALMGLDIDTVLGVCADVSHEGELAIAANLNAPGQVVIAGHTGAIKRAVESVKGRRGATAIELKVSGPFHSPLMAPARDGLRPVLEAITLHPFRFGVISNVTAEVNHDPQRLRALLLDQITSPVRWEDSMKALAGSGATGAFEFGAGRVLAGLMRRIDKSFKVRSIEDTSSLRAAVDALAAGEV